MCGMSVTTCRGTSLDSPKIAQTGPTRRLLVLCLALEVWHSDRAACLTPCSSKKFSVTSQGRLSSASLEKEVRRSQVTLMGLPCPVPFFNEKRTKPLQDFYCVITVLLSRERLQHYSILVSNYSTPIKRLQYYLKTYSTTTGLLSRNYSTPIKKLQHYRTHINKMIET